MLKELNVEDKLFLYDCIVKGDVIQYNLYESDENWIATKTEEEVKQTLQLLNKRIKYDAATAYDTLQNAQPESANWTDRSETSANAKNALERILKLKYRVKGCPFNFEWHLKKQDNSLTINLPVNQVVSLVEILPAHIEMLMGVLRRKEEEILQYKTEYGNLRRSTIATKPFKVEQFHEQYYATDMKVKSLQKIIARWRAEHADAELELAQIAENSNQKNVVKKEEPETSSPTTSKNVRESPRNRKRKAMQAHKTKLTRTLQTRKLELEYLSQSQSLSEADQPNGSKELNEGLVHSVCIAEDALNIQSNENEFDEESKNKKALSAKDILIKSSTSKTAMVIDSEQVAKDIPSKMKKISPRSEARPNTRQRRRKCETPENSSNELFLIENTSTVAESIRPAEINVDSTGKTIVATKINAATNLCVTKKVETPIFNKDKLDLVLIESDGSQQVSQCETPDLVLGPNSSENVVYTVHDSVESETSTNVPNAIKTTKSQLVTNEPSTTKLSIRKKEEPKNDISSYVDSVLCQLDAFDKKLKLQFSNAGIN